MKKKTVIKSIAVLLSAILGVAVFTSCEKECEHQVNAWKVEREATCTTEGLRRGPCVNCGDVIEEKIPVDPEHHVYGDWEITKLPVNSSTGSGKAVKTCTENSGHTLEVTLPRITDTGVGYAAAEIVTPATVLNEGELHLVYEHEEGDIVFSVPTDKKKINLNPNPETGEKIPVSEIVHDAVLLGWSNHDKVRRGNGTKNEGMGHDSTTFSYEYGDNYTHIVDAADRREYWYSLTDDDKLYAIWKDGVSAGNRPEEYADAKEDAIKGYGYNIGQAGSSFYYGAEDLLKGVYDWGASADNNGDFYQELSTHAGRQSYKYGFSYYNPPDRYSIISVEFTLTEDYVADYLCLKAYSYPGSEFTVTGDAEGGWACKLNEDANWLYDESIEYHQTTVAEDPEVPQNPYGENSLKISSYDLICNGKVLSETEPTELEADAKYIFTVRDIQPQTSDFYYDPVTIYWLKSDGTRMELDYGTLGDDKMLCYYQKDNGVFQYRSHYAGDVTLLFVTASGNEKKVLLHVNPITPSALYASTYEYGDTGYLWSSTTSSTAESTVYVGQPLVFRANVPNQEKTYVDHGFEALLSAASDGGTMDAATIETVTQDNAPAAKFTAAAPGTYTIVLRSVKYTSIRIILYIHVEEPPAIETILSGTYTGRINYPSKGNVTVTFTDVNTAEVKTNKGTEILTLQYNEETGVLSSTHKEGVNMGISLSLNEAYRIVLINPTGFGSGKENVVLSPVEPEETPSEPPEA